MSESAKSIISESIVTRTTDGTDYELQPTDLGQISLQPVNSDPGDGETMTMSPGQFQLQIRGGEFYFPDGDTSTVMDAVKTLREI